MLFTKQDLTDFLGGNVAVTDGQVDVVHQMIKGYITARSTLSLDRVEDKVVLVPGGAQYLVPPRRPVVSVASVEYRAVGNTWELHDPASWDLMPVGIQNLTAGSWSLPWYRITYTYGYDTVPEDIKGAVIRAAADLVTNPRGIRQEGLGSYNVTYSGSDDDIRSLIGPNVQPIIDRFRRRGTTGAMRL